MNRITFFIGILILILSCKNYRDKQTTSQNDTKDSLTINSNDINQGLNSSNLVPDSIAALYKTDYYKTNHQKYYFTEKNINGELKSIIHDYMDIDRFLINGSFIQYSPYDSLISKLGTPNSYSRIDDFDYHYSKYLYDGLRLTMHDYDSLAYCDMIDFKDSKNFILYDNLRFDSNTLISDFVRLYPLSCLNVEHNRIYNNEISCDWIRFEPKGDYRRDDEHIFLFHNGYLRFYLYFNGDD